MAKIFYVTETGNDNTTAHFFKTEKEALNYGKSQVKDFEMKQDMWGDGFHDEENDIWFGGEWINTRYGILMSWEEDRVYIQSADDEEARKFIRSSKHDKKGSAIFFDSFKKGMYGILGNRTEGKGYTWTFEDGEVNESKTIMKYLPTFESFVNEYSTIVETKKMIKALKKAIKAADSFDTIGTELDDLDYREKYQWELVEDGSRFSSNDYDGKYPVYVITYLAGSRHAIADPKFWKNSAEIEEQVGDVAIGWITSK